MPRQTKAKKTNTTVKTLIMAVLDESGSMGVKRADVIGGFNQFLDTQRKLPDPCRLGIIKFNTEVNRFQAPRTIADTKDLDDKTYLPGGNTALFDAMASAIKIADEHRAEGERVLMLIVTDGEENSSRETSLDQVKSQITAKEALGDWTFTYLGVDPSKWAGNLGINISNTQTYQHQAPRHSFAAVAMATSAFRKGAAVQTSNFYGGPSQAADDPADFDLFARPSPSTAQKPHEWKQ